MDFTLSKEHEMARKLFHDFAENEVKPLAQEVDETEHFPEETVKKMQKLGFMFRCRGFPPFWGYIIFIEGIHMMQ